MKKRLILCIGLLAFLLAASAFHAGSNTAPSNPASDINWMSWEEVIEQMTFKKEKKIFVSIYRDHCGWCKKMENTTFKDPVIVQYINENFLPVKLNLEHPDPIIFGDKTYKSTKADGKIYHELAAYLTMGNLGAPTSVFLSEDGKVLQPLPGFKDPIMFEVIMTYYGNNHHVNTPWSMYKESYVPFAKKQLISVD